ncbi:MAG: hypothetical protein U0797_06635 [Gemmataceae bacterium]
MRYLCTIYTHNCTLAGARTFQGTEPAFDSPAGAILVRGSSERDAAARAYVQAVGHGRARGMRKQGVVREEIIAQETNPRAIAASLRKVTGRAGVLYEMDNFADAWSIRVQAASCSPRLLRRSRLKSRLLYRSSRFPSPN